jgi:hypothetical protein
MRIEQRVDDGVVHKLQRSTVVIRRSDVCENRHYRKLRSSVLVRWLPKA